MQPFYVQCVREERWKSQGFSPSEACWLVYDFPPWLHTRILWVASKVHPATPPQTKYLWFPGTGAWASTFLQFPGEEDAREGLCELISVSIQDWDLRTRGYELPPDVPLSEAPFLPPEPSSQLRPRVCLSTELLGWWINTLGSALMDCWLQEQRPRPRGPPAHVGSPVLPTLLSVPLGGGKGQDISKWFRRDLTGPGIRRPGL